jgi:uncharacterized Tic20 family protein
MNERISLNFRLIAATLHSVGTIVAGAIAFMLFFVVMKQPMPPGDITAGIMLSILCSPTVSWLMWLMTKSLDPFVDRVAKDAMNCTLTIWMIMLCGMGLYIFVFLMTCGSYLSGGNNGSFTRTIEFVAAIFGAIAIVYSLNSAVAAIFALRGHGFKSFLTYPFIRSD